MMVTLRVQLETSLIEQFGGQDNLPLHAPPPWNAQADVAFFDVDDQPVLVPTHRAWSDLQAVAFLDGIACAALGHHPARAFAI